MTDATTIARQHDPSLCPSWCNREHLGFSLDKHAGGSFHHESHAMLPTNQPHVDSDDYLFVVTSQFVDEAGETQPAVVELQDSKTTVAVLTPDEATELAQALLTAAAKAQTR
jgi:hypothetical protein